MTPARKEEIRRLAVTLESTDFGDDCYDPRVNHPDGGSDALNDAPDVIRELLAALEEAETVGAERERGHMLAWAEKRREWLRRENMAGGSAFVEKQQTDYFRDVIAHALYRPDPRDDGTRY